MRNDRRLFLLLFSEIKTVAVPFLLFLMSLAPKRTIRNETPLWLARYVLLQCIMPVCVYFTI